MNLLDAIKEKGCPFCIPDTKRRRLPKLFKQLGFKVGAEIGVYRGDYMRWLLRAGLTVYGIDPWLQYSDYRNRQSKMEAFYEQAKAAVAPWGDKCKLIRKTSMEAVKQFADNSLDFVYIDANHKFRYIAEDLCEWAKKVRPGGIVSGHDYWEDSEVQAVVDAYVKAFKIKNWYLLGRDEYLPGEMREPARTWMWFKE